MERSKGVGRTLAARELRRRATPAERVLWRRLRDRRLGGFKFRRQARAGPFFLDFYCAEGGIAIELDGDAHEEPAQARYDRARTEALAARGLRVLRFRNDELLSSPGPVLARIRRALLDATEHPAAPRPADPLPSSGGGKGGALSPQGRGKG